MLGLGDLIISLVDLATGGLDLEDLEMFGLGFLLFWTRELAQLRRPQRINAYRVVDDT